MNEHFRSHLSQNPILAILRSSSSDFLEPTIDTLVEAGITTLEVTLTTPHAAKTIEAARAKYSSLVEIGAGTVTTIDLVDAAQLARAQFIVCPNTDRSVIARATQAGMPSLPGAFTPSEILQAWQAGATAVKVFPARSLGPDFIRDVHAPLPNIPLIAVGGVELTHVRAFLDAGALALGIGSPLIGDALSGGSQSALRQRAEAFLSEAAAR